MRDLSGGLRAPCRYSGFTMIEVMVVILIIGILVNFLVVNFEATNPSKELQTQAQRFISLTELASEEALLRSVLIGIAFKEDSYHFLIKGEETWEPIQDNLFRERMVPETIQFRLLTEQIVSIDAQTDDSTPDVILLSSGEMTPFELEITSQMTHDLYRITGTETGNLHLDYIPDEQE